MTRTLQVASMAAEARLPCTPHSANLSMVTLFTMHRLGAIPNAGKYLEFSLEGPDYYPWQGGFSSARPKTSPRARSTFGTHPARVWTRVILISPRLRTARARPSRKESTLANAVQ